MANLFERAKREKEQKQVPLPKVKAEVIVDGAYVNFRVNLDDVAKVAVEREGTRDERGTVVKYTKNPAVMLVAEAKGVQVCQVNPADGCEYLLEVDFALGQGGAGVYAPITRTKIIGAVVDGQRMPEPSEA